MEKKMTDIYTYNWHTQTDSSNVSSQLFWLTINGDKVKISWKWQVFTTYGVNNPPKMLIHNIHCKIWILLISVRSQYISPQNEAPHLAHSSLARTEPWGNPLAIQEFLLAHFYCE